MLESVPLVAFLPSLDLERSRRFFCDVLGLPLLEQTPYACVLASGPTTLRVTKVEELVPQPFTVLGWTVTDIRSSLEQLAVNGVTTNRYEGVEQDDQGIWTTPGGELVAWFPDPDGNTLSLTQHSIG